MTSVQGPRDSQAPGASPAIIEVRNLRATFGETVILDDVSFQVQRGEILVILGESGSGKSTLLRHMIGLYTPARGEILIAGRDLAHAQGKKRQDILRTFGVMYQSGALFGSMSLIENVRLPLEEFTRLSGEAIELVAQMKLKWVGLAGFGDRLPSQLSGGMQKRAAIARAMALDPMILFLDEPSAGLDPITSAEIDELILRLARSLHITFVIVSHELASIHSIADRVIMLDKKLKKIVATGRPADLKEHSDNPWVRRFFNRQAGDGEPLRQ